MIRKSTEILSKHEDDVYYQATGRSDILEAMEEYTKPYKSIADLISRIYYYGEFKAHTPNERRLEQLLTDVGLWPTTEDEIIKRGEL